MEGIYTQTIQLKINGKYVATYTENRERLVYESLSHDLIAHFINKARYIKRIVRTPRYNGTDEITVYYDNNTRSVYIIAN